MEQKCSFYAKRTEIFSLSFNFIFNKSWLMHKQTATNLNTELFKSCDLYRKHQDVTRHGKFIIRRIGGRES